MKIETFEDLFIMELKDLYSAEKQILKALPKIIKHVTSSTLKTALENHLQETEGQLERLEKISELLDKKLTGHACKAMEGLIKEGDELMKEVEKGDVLDAGLIGACQRVEHYEIAGYGTARTYAGLLGQTEVQKLLQETLDQEGAADHKLTKIAESQVNSKAMQAV